MQYVIKTVPGEDTQELQNLLNEMSMNGWELYSMHEVESDDGIQCNCIFMSEMSSKNKTADTVDIGTLRSQMEKMLLPELNPYELCLDIQDKIRLQQDRISRAKSELENETHSSRKKLNDKISSGLKELDELREKLARTTCPDEMYSKLNEEKLAVCLSSELTGSTDEMISQTVKLRLKLTEELGYIVPRILFCDDEDMNPFEFSIRIRGTDVIRVFVHPDCKMFYADDFDTEIKDAIYDVDAMSGKEVVWIEKKQCKSFWATGLTACEYIAKALEYTAVKYVDELLDYEELEKYINVVDKKNPYLVENIIPDFLTLADLRFVLTNLIREKVSVKDIVYIFEKLNDYAQEGSRFDLLNKLRLAFSRRICKTNMDENGVIQAFEISEKTLSGLAPDFDDDDIVRIDADAAEKFAEKIQNEVTRTNSGAAVKLIAPMELRHMLFILLTHYMNDITVLSREEIGCNATVEVLGEV